MKVTKGQTLYAMNDIEVEVTDVEIETVQIVKAVRKSDGFKYYFKIVNGVQMHYRPDSYLDDDSGGEYKPNDFFKNKPMRRGRYEL